MAKVFILFATLILVIVLIQNGSCMKPHSCTTELTGDLQVCPNSEGTVCIQCNDQCQYNSDCAYGESCCLIRGCGKTCRPQSTAGMKPHSCTTELTGDLQVCPNSNGTVCIQCNDQCQYNSDCAYGETCCLIRGCGKTCRPQSTAGTKPHCTSELTGDLKVCPNSEQTTCITCNDQCRDTSDCAGGQSCCLVRGCGKECHGP